MSGFGAWLARAVAALGGPQTAGIILIAGILVGGAGGAILTKGSSGGSSGGGTDTLAVYPCPDQGPALTTIGNGQQLLVTGRSQDGTWLRIHLPMPGRDEGWVQAAPLTVNGSVGTLPVATCAAEANAPSPAGEPAPSLTAILGPSAAPSETPPPTAPPPSGPPPSQTANAPTISGLGASLSTISYDQGSYCPNAPSSTTISAKVADATAISSVTLFWRKPGASTYLQTSMSRTTGSATSGTWQAVLDTKANGITQAGQLAYFAVARDAGGASTRSPSSGSRIVTVAVCANKGPSITQASSSAGSTMYWVPAGALGNCQTATNITAVVSDPDGIKSVRLYYRKPGSSTWLSKPMDNQTLPGKWYANLDTLGDQIQKTGTLSWYVKAVDGKGASAQTKTFALAIKQCDSPASISVSASSKHVCQQISTTFYADVTDLDGLSTTSASLIYTYRLSNGTSKTVKVTMTYSDSTGPTRYIYYYNLYAGAGWTSVTWYVQTRDLYGGISKSASQKFAAGGC